MNDGNSEIAELLSKVEVEDYLDTEAIDYKIVTGSSGRQANIRECPKCGNSHWKVYLNTDTGLGNCFAGDCEAKFNRWSFIKAHLGADDTRAVVDHLKAYAKTIGWRPKRLRTAAVEIETPQVKLPLSFALPTDDGRNLLYLDGRGITSPYAAYFNLRFCEDGWWSFAREDGSRGGQNFSGRVIIPVFDLDGTIVTFQGRDITGKAERKYLFPSKLPGSGRFLLNGQNAHHTKRVTLSEGFFDVAAVKIAIDEDEMLRDIVPLGSFGKHLSGSIEELGANDQLQRFLTLKRGGLEEVIIMWDGEKRALLDAINAGQKLQKLGLKVRVALLPAGKDPNEVPAQVVREAIYGARELTPALAIQWQLRNPYG